MYAYVFVNVLHVFTVIANKTAIEQSELVSWYKSDVNDHHTSYINHTWWHGDMITVSSWPAATRLCRPHPTWPAGLSVYHPKLETWHTYSTHKDIYIYIYMYIYIYLYLSIYYIWEYQCIFTHIYIYIYTYTNSYAKIHSCVYLCRIKYIHM